MESNEVRYQTGIAQMVEQRNVNPYVAGSIPAPTRVKTPDDRGNDYLKGPRGVSGYPSGFSGLTAQVGLSECESGVKRDGIGYRQKLMFG